MKIFVYFLGTGTGTFPSSSMAMVSRRSEFEQIWNLPPVQPYQEVSTPNVMANLFRVSRERLP